LRKEAYEAQLAAERARLADEQKNSHTNAECDNPTVIDSED